MKPMKYPNIDVERVRKNMTRAELAAQLGVGRRTLYNWIESGNIPEAQLTNMSLLFGCSVDYLVGVEPARTS